MEKISIEVRIPALGRSCNFIMPNNMSVQDAQKLMIKILSSEYGISHKNEDVMLFDMEDHVVLRPECSFTQLGISDGARLLMI